MVGNKDLVDLIKKKYGTKTAFAKELGWSKQRLNEFLKAHENATIDPIQEVIDKLDLDYKTARLLFYAH